MAMVTFKAPKAEKGKAAGRLNSASEPEESAPPRLYLEHGHLEKLGMKKMPKVGAKLHFHAVGHVGSTSENQDSDFGGGKLRRHMTLHIHQMEMGDGDQPGQTDVDQEEESKAGAKAEMDKALSRGAGSESSKSKSAGGKKGQPGG